MHPHHPGSGIRGARAAALAVLVAGAAAFALLALPAPGPQAPAPAPSGPPIPPAEFARLVEELSEPEGYFDTDNFISNETSYLHVLDKLREHVPPGGAYIGVGPGQNLTYIAHTQPDIAVIADIRRQNMLQHLLFKVLIEDAANRSDFLCRLLARRCAPAPSGEGFPEMLARVRAAPPDPRLLEAHLDRVREVLGGGYPLALTSQDWSRIEYVYRSFFEGGLDLRFSTLGRPSLRYPTFEELMLETDLEGRYGHFLSDNVLFERVQRFQRENRLIPIVGDFSGEQALRAAAAFLSARGTEVGVFYTSNVEFYLFGLAAWDRFVANVGAFDYRDGAVFIRAYFPTYGRPHRLNVPGHRSTTLLQSVAGFLEDAAAGTMRSYWDVVARHNY